MKSAREVNQEAEAALANLKKILENVRKTIEQAKQTLSSLPTVAEPAAHQPAPDGAAAHQPPPR